MTGTESSRLLKIREDILCPYRSHLTSLVASNPILGLGRPQGVDLGIGAVETTEQLLNEERPFRGWQGENVSQNTLGPS
jgi:hypothetical protein